ncbi:MAG: hypothetical protein LBI67_06745 [Treponema sp.]|jgi:hypothetical protein|nr:hypothetical protein [Treponema sp.]
MIKSKVEWSDVRPATLLLLPLFFISCESAPNRIFDTVAGTAQRVVYNGQPRPFTAGPGFVIRYYPSPAALESASPAGFGVQDPADAPVEPGRYFVRIEHSQAPGDYAAAELVIERAYITLSAEKTQQANYDGNPKRITAVSDPPLALSFSYYPTEEIRREAVQSFFENGRQQTSVQGFRRIDRAPVEPGIYYVAVYFGGNEHYRPEVTEVDFTIIGKSPAPR